MARHSIIEKLDTELQKFPVRRESQVVYLLAEIRKVIEYEKIANPNAYEVLELFCNWALHITISRKSNADRIRLFLKAFDLKTGMSITDYLQTDFFRKIMHLEAFREALESFLCDNHLPCRIVQDYRSWSGFIYLYTSVVSEVPLQYTRGDLLPEEVEELTVTHWPQQDSSQKLVRWAVKLKKGQELAASTLYGEYRNEHNVIIAMPDFFREEGFQV